MKAIIFDFDGVLGDTFELNYSTFKYFFPEITIKEFQDIHNGNIFNNKYLDINLEEYAKIANSKLNEKHLFPFVKELLEKLSNRFNLFIVSSGTDEKIVKILNFDNCEKYFEKIMGHKVHKCKEEKIKMIFNEYGIKNEDCFFVTDTLGDLKYGQKLKIKTIAVDWGYHDMEILEKGNPFRIVSNFVELLEVIDSENI